MNGKVAASYYYSLKQSLPVLVSFIPVGLAYGILMQTAGYNWLWCGACSVFVFAGSLQMLMVSFFAGGISLVTVAVMALLLNARHIFYGIPFVEKWRDYGPVRLFLIFALPDEAFSLHCAGRPGPECSEKWVFFFNALLVYLYWLISSVSGALLGSLIRFDTTGIDFAMTAMFIVILIEQLRSGGGSKLPAVCAVVSSLVCLLIFGADSFILPSLMITVVLLFILRGRIEAKELPEETQKEAEA